MNCRDDGSGGDHVGCGGDYQWICAVCNSNSGCNAIFTIRYFDFTLDHESASAMSMEMPQ